MTPEAIEKVKAEVARLEDMKVRLNPIASEDERIVNALQYAKSKLVEAGRGLIGALEYATGPMASTKDERTHHGLIPDPDDENEFEDEELGGGDRFGRDKSEE